MTAMGSEWTQCSNIVASGPYTAPYRRFTSDRIIRTGDFVVIDIGGCYNGYWGDFTRTVMCGRRRSNRRANRGLPESATIPFSLPATQHESAIPTTDVYKAAGEGVRDNLGHGAGVSPWEPPYFSASSEKERIPLKENMVLNLEPYVGIPGKFGVRLENNLIVRDGDPGIFTTLPFDERLVSEVHHLDRTTGRMPLR